MTTFDTNNTSTQTAYGTSAIEPRRRRTTAEITALKDAIYEITITNQPCSTRQIYYVGIGELWEKDQNRSRANYQRVNRYVGEMREAGEMPWEWITDSTRLCRIPQMYDSIEAALAETAEFYRRDLWRRQPRRVEVWCESESIGSVLHPVTSKLGLGLFPCRGQGGKGFIYESVGTWVRMNKPVTVLYVGDWDPSGLAIPRSVRERQERYSGGQVDLDFRRVAVTPADVAGGNLTSHEVNTRDANYGRYVTECRSLGLDPSRAIEVEAIPAPVLRARLEAAIYDLVDDPDSWNATLEAERSERDLMAAIAAGEVAQ